MTRLFYDCEFIDTGERIHLISIGIVRDDGATYYAEPHDTPTDEASDWVNEHVLAYTHLDPEFMKPRAQIAAEIVAFAGPDPRWYAYVDHYDWICLSQLYGPLVDRPAHWPWGSMNLATLAAQVWIDPETEMPNEVELTKRPMSITVGHDLWPDLLLPDGAHHALAGAIWDRVLWDRIQLKAGDDPDYVAVVDA